MDSTTKAMRDELRARGAETMGMNDDAIRDLHAELFPPLATELADELRAMEDMPEPYERPTVARWEAWLAAVTGQAKYRHATQITTPDDTARIYDLTEFGAKFVATISNPQLNGVLVYTYGTMFQALRDMANELAEDAPPEDER